MATLIRPGETPTFIEPENRRTFTLEELQGLVGGYIEALRMPWATADDGAGLWMVINEDGKRLALPLNGFATHLMARAIGRDDFIVGPAVICTRVEMGVEDG